MPFYPEGLKGNESTEPLVGEPFEGAGSKMPTSAQILADIEDGLGYRISVVDTSGNFQHPIAKESM